MPMTPPQPYSQMALPHGHILLTNSSQTRLGGSSASTSMSEVPVYPAQNMTNSTSAPSVVALRTMPFLGPASNVHPLSDDSLPSQLLQLTYSDFSPCVTTFLLSDTYALTILLILFDTSMTDMNLILTKTDCTTAHYTISLTLIYRLTDNLLIGR